jgi:hypothetical protein
VNPALSIEAFWGHPAFSRAFRRDLNLLRNSSAAHRSILGTSVSRGCVFQQPLLLATTDTVHLRMLDSVATMTHSFWLSF